MVAEAGDGASAIDLANRLDLDLILLDLNMKGMSGLDTLNALRRDGVTAQIIIITVSDSASDIYALIDAGADGYLLKDSEPESLLAAIQKGRTVEKYSAPASVNICANVNALVQKMIRSALLQNVSLMYYTNWRKVYPINRLPRH